MKYAWRQMTDEQRTKALQERYSRDHPWHSPPHRGSDFESAYLFTAACYEHASVIGSSAERMNEFVNQLLAVMGSCCSRIYAWVVLPNHYHVLVRTPDALNVIAELGTLHGRTSFEWNGQDHQRGRKVWHRAVETRIKSHEHQWATINYIHHNAVKHGYTQQWNEWPFSSAVSFLESVGRDEATHLWRTYPIQDYGKGWDD